MPKDRERMCFDSEGHLPPGTHDCILDELRSLVVTNDHRRMLWSRLVDFFDSPLLAFNFGHAYIGGSFLSKKPFPDDIDVILHAKAPYGAQVFNDIEPFFTMGLPYIHDAYSVHLHFFIDGAPEGMTDFRAFLQRWRATDKESSPIRGLARIDLTAHHNLPQLRISLLGDLKPAAFHVSKFDSQEAKKAPGLPDAFIAEPSNS